MWHDSQEGCEVLSDTKEVLKLPGRVLGMSEKVRRLTEYTGKHSEAAWQHSEDVCEGSEAVWEVLMPSDKVSTVPSICCSTAEGRSRFGLACVT